MADIKLVIKADALQAEKDFQSFAAMSEKTKKAIEEFQKSFNPKSIDDFIAKNKLAALGISQTQGPLKGLTAETKGYEKQIKTLISSGLSPQSAEIQKLQAEYARAGGKLSSLTALTKAQTTATHGHTSAITSGIKSIISYAAAYLTLHAAVNAVKALTIGLAEQGEEAAETSRRIGLTAEAYQELKYAASFAGISTESFSNSMEKLNKTLGEAKVGTGALVSYLSKANPELLRQVQAAGSSEKAFNLLADAINQTKNPMDRAALATAAFGRSGQQMITMMEDGSVGINKLREEARKYGLVMSNEMAIASEQFMDAQQRLGGVLKGLIITIGTPLIGPITEAMKGFTDWAREGDNLSNTLKTIGYILAMAAGAFAAYTIASKASAVGLGIMTIAQKGLNVAMSASVIGAIAAVIMMVLVPAIILLYKNWDLVKYKIIDFGLAAKQKMLELGLIVREKVMGAIIALLNKLSDIPGIGKAFKYVADQEQAVTDAMRKNVEEIKIQREANEIAFLALDYQNKQRIEGAAKEAKAVTDANSKIIESTKQRLDAYKELLNQIPQTEAMIQGQMLESTIAFFEQRAELESQDFERRLAFMNEQYVAINAIENVSTEQRKLMQQGLTKAIEKEQKKQTLARAQYGAALLDATANLLTNLQTIFKNAGKSSRELAIMFKVVSMAQAAIATYLAFNKALASAPPPYSFILAGITLAAGLAQVAAIASTPIPSGQTGLDYTVPDMPSNRNDKHAVNASAGERVSVTPRGEDTEKTTMIDIKIEEDTIFSVVQRGFDTGKLTFSNKNIRGGVFA
jgi:hypothetical protein